MFSSSLALNMGGDDVTEFLYVLLQQIKFPYRDADLNRSYDWAVLEDLKTRLCTLAEVTEYSSLAFRLPANIA
jgi:actin-related protein 8